MEKNLLDGINQTSSNTLVGHLGIEVTAFTGETIIGTMPVDQRTKQPMGLLHGGASVVLAESLGSIGSALLVMESGKVAVGQSITANHIKSASSGLVTGLAKLVHKGRASHLWDITITNEQQQIVCVCRLTMAIIDKKFGV